MVEKPVLPTPGPRPPTPSVALIHDYLNQYGGAERVLEALHGLYPAAPIYTSLYDREGMRRLGFLDEGKEIRTSFMQRLGFLQFFPRFYFTFLYPLAFRWFNFQRYDVLISDASYAAKYVRVPRHTVHVCYCHTPPRFLYDFDNNMTRDKMNGVEYLLSSLAKLLLRPLDQWWSRGVDIWIANSSVTQARIRQVYKREAHIIYPPVEMARFAGKPIRDEGYFLVVSRLNEYKRIELIVAAFNQLGWPLKVVGRGPLRGQLVQMARPNVHILEALPDEQVTELYLNCRAMVLAANEDAGITQLEAMACGKPVVALGQGGYVDTVIDGITGVLYPEQTMESLAAGLQRFAGMEFDAEAIRQYAAQYDVQAFQEKIREIVTANAGRLHQDSY